MDSSHQDDMIQNYEKMLKAESFQRPSLLYSDINQVNIQHNNINKMLSVKDVITNVTAQVRAIQNADSPRGERKSSTFLNEYRKSSFMPVNMFAQYEKKREEIKNKNINKFETQCVSDTQLLDLIQNAEALIDTNKEISHEFDTTFDMKTGQNDDGEFDNEAFNKIEEEFDIEYQSRSPEIPRIKNISLSEMSSSNSQNKFFNFNDNCTQLLNETIGIEPNRLVNYDGKEDFKMESLKTRRNSNSSPLFNIDDEEIPSSYVFSSIRRSKSKTPSPLVFNLEIFENFEKEAASVIDNDIELISLDTKEQTLNDPNESDLLESRGCSSPVLKLSTRPKAVKSRKNTNADKSTIIPNDNNKENKSKMVSIDYEDEILFSSDEEDYVLKDTEDLPFTCALETSFYEQSGVLDKTMYVGFQTASFKSIQVSCKSFERAKTVFEDLNINQKPFTDLVDICDSLTTLNDKEVDNEESVEIKSKCKSPFWIMESEFDFKEEVAEINTKGRAHLGYPENENKVASKKVIKLSEKALAKCRKELQDIDDNGTSEFNEDALNTQPNKITLPNMEEVHTVCIKDVNTKLDEEFLKEFENTNIPFLDNVTTQSLIKKDEFVGFKTASDKNINISDKGLTKCQVIFHDDLPNDLKAETESIDKENESMRYTKLKDSTFLLDIGSNIAGLINFKTASNKHITISDLALVKSKAIFRDVDKIDQSVKENHKDKHKEGEFYPVTKITEKEKMEDIKIKSFDNVNDTGLNDPVINDSLKYYFDSEFVLQDDDSRKESQEINVATTGKVRNEFIENNITLNNENKDLLFKIPESIGFKTASNKKVDISAKALLNSKKIFEGIDLTEDLDNCVKIKGINNNFVGFKTASNNNIYVSNDALMRSKKIFEEIDTNDNAEHTKESKNLEYSNTNKIFDDVYTTYYKSQNLKTIHGIQTASNKTVNVSDEALAKSNNFFEDINNADINIILNAETIDKSVRMDVKAATRTRCLDDVDVSTNESIFKGFQTSSNKNVKTSKESPKKSIKLIESIKNPFENSSKIKKFQSDSDNLIKSNEAIAADFKGFQTASNKEIKISNIALAISKKLFGNIDDDPINTETVPGKEETFKEFRTGNKKEVEVSVEALIKTRETFKNIDDISKNCDLQTFYANSFNGFQSASNKKVNISHESLVKSRKLFDDVDENISDSQINKDYKPPKYAEMSHKGFQTANKKPVKISEEALARSRELFEDINELSKKAVDLHAKEFAFEGFHTDSDKNVTLSKKALAAAKTVFENMDSKKIKTNDGGFKGFQTASKKKVTISDEALITSRKLFDDIIDMDDPKVDVKRMKKTPSDNKYTISKEALGISKEISHDIKENYLIRDISDKEPIFRGFKTGNESEVNISKDALERSRKKLNEHNNNIFDNEKLNTNQKDKNIKSAATGALTHQKLHKNGKDNIENIIIDTQVINDFDETLNTEDFHKVTPKVSKRSGSPILSCPKAKRRKIFTTPYNTTSKIITKPVKEKQDKNAIVFNENYKKIKKYTYKDLPDNKNCKSIDKSLMNLDFDTILNFEFLGTRNEMNSNNVWTIDNIKKTFLCSVNKKLVPEGWLDNHLRLILWKLISYEFKFRIQHVCTVKNVMEQLKYRYDRELYRAERPAIRKILERDDSSMKTMILCVVGIYSDGVKVSSVTNTTNIELLLTDGWYCIKATIDNMLSKLVYDGKIVVGCKIATHGAELLNCEQGMAPWENTSAVRLKLSGNSTRLSAWHARLGYHGNAAILSRLSSVKPEGGKVSKLRLFVARVYPTLYVEKFDDGSTVTRSERLENIHQMKCETERQNILEKLYEEVEKEIPDQESQDSELSQSSGKRRCLDTGSQISKLMKKSGDPSEFRMRLTESQTRLLDDHTTKQREKLLENIQTKVHEKLKKNALYASRNVVSLLKIRAAGIEERNGSLEVSKAMLSIWKPSDAILDIIKENSWIDVMNVVPTAIRYSEIQISAGRQSLFNTSKCKENEKTIPYTQSLKRTCYNIHELIQNTSKTTNFTEIDTVGLIFEIDPPMRNFDPKTQPFQNVYLTDANKNIICVNFWGGIKKFGFENVLGAGEIVTCVNLQKRAGNTRKNVPQYRVTEFTYFTKTPKNVDAREIDDLLSAKFANIDRGKFCSDCVALKNNYFALRPYVELSPYRLNQSDYNMSRNKMFIDTPLAVKKDDLNLSGLDFESTFQTELSPQALLRKNKVKEKIAKLKMYGEPPPLSPIFIKNISKNATSAYKSPLLNDSCNVASAKNTSGPKPVEKSPVLLSRGTRRHANPVKLDFSSCKDDTIDHFAEEFEASPPLSLDSNIV